LLRVAQVDDDVTGVRALRQAALGYVVAHLSLPEYQGKPMLTLDNIESPHTVRDLINSQVGEAVAMKQTLAQTQYQPPSSGGYATPATASPAPAPASAPGIDVADQLRKLAELRDLGVLTEEEFTLQKQRLLGG